MLNREGAVIIDQPEGGNEIAPGLPGGAVANRAEDPGSVKFVAVMFGIEHPVQTGVPLPDGSIFGVNVPDGSLERSNSCRGVDTLPDEMRGVEVSTDFLAGRQTQFQKGLRIVDQKSRMHL